MAVDNDSLTTLTNAKEVLGVSGTGQDTEISNLIDRCSDWFEQQTNRKIKTRNYNDGSSTHTTTSVSDEPRIRFDGHNHAEFVLPQYPVQRDGSADVSFKLEELDDRGADVTGNETWTTLDEYDDYIVDKQTGIIRLVTGNKFRTGVFTSGIENFRVTMAAGYDTVPEDVEMAVLELIRIAYERSDTLQSESIGQLKRTFASDKSSRFIDEIVESYRRRDVDISKFVI